VVVYAEAGRRIHARRKNPQLAHGADPFIAPRTPPAR
jgi:hypothetical protein